MVAAAMCPGRFQLEITIITTGKEELLTREVTVVKDLLISVSERLFTIIVNNRSLTEIRRSFTTVTSRIVADGVVGVL